MNLALSTSEQGKSLSKFILLAERSGKFAFLAMSLV
jgi:hypothetical protein